MPKTKSFEENLQELEIIISKLESGQAGLDECMDLYKKGIKLSETCSKMLEEAEQQVKIISQDESFAE